MNYDLDWRESLVRNSEWTGRACYSRIGHAYRYLVDYQARAGGHRTMTWIMLNPSTATHDRMDPTLRRCWTFARNWGYAGMTVLNLWAYRSTDPRQLTRAVDPIGPANDYIIDKHLQIQHDLYGPEHLVVCGWGGNGPRSSNRPREVYDRIIGDGHYLRSLTTTKSGQPGHPLYLRRDLEPGLCLRPPEQQARERLPVQARAGLPHTRAVPAGGGA